MNTETTQAQTALTLPQRAAVALNSSKTEEDLRALVASSIDITEVKNSAGRDQAHAIGMRLRTARTSIEKTGKAAREDAKEFCAAVIAEERRLIDIIQPEEQRIIKMRDDYDAAIEAERQAKIAAERSRIEGIQNRIKEMANAPLSVIGAGSGAIGMKLSALLAVEIDDSFAEFKDQAASARASSLEALERAYGAALQAEESARIAEEQRRAEAARIEAERAELAALRAEKEARERAQAEQDRVAAETKRELEEWGKMLADQRLSEEQRRAAEQERFEDAEQASGTVVKPLTPEAAWPFPNDARQRQAALPVAAIVDGPAVLGVGDFGARLGFTVSVAFVSSLGIEPAEKIKGLPKYRESDFQRLCAALIVHIQEAAQAQLKQAA
ncbi:hypothetical protein [Massilia sp. TS11]|uniref:hypothetical protein n=1 Tax=Massilia sp. TS11 TaxID=2908003 RepID=UPI001ED9F755|nr:hypothetical protein [Massilia sp. TS11]MCG2586538.1 hypothetical protein [Massilia sp. TS11]